MKDKRLGGRKSAFLTAYASLGGTQGVVPCLVRDRSQAGARLIVAGASRLPDIFDLHINGRDHALRVKTMWRTATEAGVSLVAKVPLDRLDVGPVKAQASGG